ncbi:hypothetical protein MMC08_005469 [Hypocenomyce scalaris]|nr:hypothetical protein [Hypocenomyce scalaris]
MSSDQPMKNYTAGKLPDEEKIPCSHSSAGTSFQDVITEGQDIYIEEVSNEDFEQRTDIKVLKPYQYEEPPDLCLPESDPNMRTQTPPTPTAQHDRLVQGLRSLHCDDSDTQEARRSWLWNSKHQWTIGTGKRSYSESIGSDAKIRDREPLGGHELGNSSRRLRRRIRGRSNRSSRVVGQGRATSTIEIEEADQDVELPAAPGYASDGGLEGAAVEELEDTMDMD